MRMINLGRNRKPLIEKSSVLMFRLDNKTIFALCDKFKIDYDLESEVLSDTTKKALIGEIKNNLENFIK
ncbi:hypothetical protein [Solibacillus sp. NPDC093137]|uniref:hypothetical protein n=1 Tax=Solibacillus sp. NPDC093137 TaxID=3390678 RepID=UPI003CFCCB85